MEKCIYYKSSAHYVQISRPYSQRHCKPVALHFQTFCLKDQIARLTIIILQDKIAGNITSEQGKTLKDAFNDVSRGLGKLLYVFHGN